ncbi:MAG TPA: hypothetical protein PK420_05030, partial [Rubrivivax sp.]|nr:hypothetical protein [Rubrivivax sp.]
MSHLQGGIAVITGAASGFGLEASRIAARLGMKIVMADVQADALELSSHDVAALGAACGSGAEAVFKSTPTALTQSSTTASRLLA